MVMLNEIVGQSQTKAGCNGFDFMKDIGIPREYRCVELGRASVVESLSFLSMDDTNFSSRVEGREDDDDSRKHSWYFFSAVTRQSESPSLQLTYAV